jgi:hypothetical protein
MTETYGLNAPVNEESDRPEGVPYGYSAWTYDVATGGIQDTTAVDLVAAASGKKHYLRALQFINYDASVSTEVEILDGASVIWRGYAPAVSVGGMVSVVFPIPLESTAGNALKVKAATTSAQLIVSAQGYTEG